MIPDKKVVDDLLVKYMDNGKSIDPEYNELITAISFAITISVLQHGPSPESLNFIKCMCEILFLEGKESDVKLDESIWGT